MLKIIKKTLRYLGGIPNNPDRLKKINNIIVDLIGIAVHLSTLLSLILNLEQQISNLV